MPRYLAFAWDEEDARQVEAARLLGARVKVALPQLRVACTSTRLEVYCDVRRSGTSQIYPVGDQQGVVLGKLFQTAVHDDGYLASVDLTGARARALLESEGRHLVQQFWGQYVAFLTEQGRVFVLRDPTGAIPCYFAVFRGVQIFFTSIEDCLALACMKFTVDWNYVIARMGLPMLQARETGLAEVSQVLPGECISLRSRQPVGRRMCWDPVTISDTDPIEDVDAAAAAAHQTVSRCVAAWASGYSRIVHKLSGGLDSSIVLACLRRAPSCPQLTCVNYYERAVSGDERYYARLAFERAGPRDPSEPALVECERRAEDVDLKAVIDVSASPVPRLYLTAYDQRRMDVPIASQADAALFSGLYGDGVFFTRPQFAATDYVHRHGLGPDLLRIAHATAASQGQPLWRLLPRVIREGRRARRTPYQGLDQLTKAHSLAFVNSAVLTEVFREQGERYFGLHWLKPSDRVAPGKLFHLRMLSLPTCVPNPLELTDGTEWIAPLASQPLLELFLRIPTYVLTAGGRNRAVARRAFAAELPAEIFSRQSKGNSNGWLLEVFRLNEALYRETMLDGVLVKEKLLDRQKVERFFSTVHDTGARGLVELLQFHFNLEIWLRSWTRRVQTSLRVVA